MRIASRERSTIFRATRILSATDRKKVLGVIFLQVAFGLLDLAGVAAIGMIGALAITGVQAREPGDRVSAVLSFIHLDGKSLQFQVALIALIAAMLLITKTIFSVIFTRKTMLFLSRRGAFLSRNLVSKLFSQSLLNMQSKSLNQLMYSVTGGVEVVTIGVLGTSVNLVSDVSLLFVMGAGLFVVDPSIAGMTFLFFGFVGFILYRLLHVRAKRLGIEKSELSIRSSETLFEVISAYRETVVRNRKQYYARKIGDQRLRLADVSAEMNFMPNISKYVMEITVVVGAFGISAAQFLAQDAAHAVAVLSVFLAASTRIAPAVLRLQQGAIAIKGSLGAATPTLELIEELSNSQDIDKTSDVVETKHEGFLPTVELTDVSFKYPNRNHLAVNSVNLSVDSGEFVALVGSSGAGKTTIVDLILGIFPPLSGQIKLSGLLPSEAIKAWPGAIAYVPQDIVIFNGSIRENVGMGYPLDSIDDALIWDALRVAQLDHFVRTLPHGLDSSVGDRGTRLSGGQRQRLGIARAMFTKPALLVLDEATSSLDGETEANIANAIQEMRGSVTVLMIAHRLSTVRAADRVVYMEKGEILRVGTFDDVRSNIANFDSQAKLMGL